MKEGENEKIRQSCLDYYNTASEDYFTSYIDEIQQKPYDKAFLIDFVAKLPAQAQILDVGCASSAQQARFLRDMGLKVTAIDLSDACIKKAAANFEDIEFKQMDMLNLQFADGAFDALVAFYSIIHIPNENLGMLFSGFNRILKSSGLLMLTVHKGNFYGYFEGHYNPVFFRTYTEEELGEQLEKHGFEVLELQTREPVYEHEFQTERIYMTARKTAIP